MTGDNLILNLLKGVSMRVQVNPPDPSKIAIRWVLLLLTFLALGVAVGTFLKIEPRYGGYVVAPSTTPRSGGI